MNTLLASSSSTTRTLYLIAFTLFATTTISNHNAANAISIKPADFDRLIMPCYLGMSPSSSSIYPSASNGQQQTSPQIQSGSQTANLNSLASPLPGSPYQSSSGRNDLLGSSSQSTSGYQPPTYYGNDQQNGGSRLNGFSTSSSTSYGRGGSDLVTGQMNSLGQQIPRANTIDNFIALVSKIEAANPRLANNVDQLIRTLLSRFRMDNYYYDVRMRAPVDDTDIRTNNIIPAILNPMNGMQQDQSFLSATHAFPEHLLSHDEKCSMYFMLSHFIDKSTPMNPSLASIPVQQLSGPQVSMRPPVLQAAGAGYPGQSAENAYTSGASGSRYSGPAPSFGSPATSNMNSYGQGINNQPDYTGRNPYGMNVLQPNNQLNVNYNNLRQTGQYSGTMSSNTRLGTPYMDGQARSRDDKVAIEYGVVSVGNQEDAAVVLNRVLMGILAPSMPKQTIRQVAGAVFTTQHWANSPMIDQEIDPLYAVTLADLWAISARTKPGKPFDIRMMGDGGHWNSTMCPTTFKLERASSIRFTTAELLGGLDGLSLGMLRMRMMEMRKNIRLSEMLRMYYSKNGFRPQMADVGVCNRGLQLSSRLDYLQMQAENYLRLYELTVPMTDAVVVTSIKKLDAFKDISRQTASQLLPQDVCAESNMNDLYPSNGQQGEQCEIARADVVTVLDTSPQSNQPFMNLVVTKLANKLGLSREGSSLSVLTNQQDSSGYGGSFSFNAIVRNSTNTAEIGCALVYDTTQSYQGGQVTDPTRLIEMFEQALISLDNEYLVRQANGLIIYNRPQSSSSSSSFLSSYSPWSSQMNNQEPTRDMYATMPGQASSNSGKNTGGSKVIVFFNYGSSLRPDRLASMGTNWQSPNSNSQYDQSAYRFQEAKRYLHENFRGSAILALSTSREEVKELVFDPDTDIFNDIPPGSGGASSPSSSSAALDYYGSSNDASTIANLNGPADQLVARLTQRMCKIPAVFQYPMCFRVPSENTASVGYITPGRKQYWMMSPKTFFSSRTVRLAFKVDGGRLRVCFGRKPNPDETALRSGQQQQYQYNTISIGANPLPASGNPNGNVPQQQIQPTSSDYYTGMEYGICKDVSPGQEIDFIITDPCYKRSIAECDPFYFVVKETSNPGETDPNYMCRDPGCKRFDQVRFVLTHSGVSCSSAIRTVIANWYFIVISMTLVTFGFQDEVNCKQVGHKLINGIRQVIGKTSMTAASVSIMFASICNIQLAQAQQAGVYDFGQNRYGEKRGNFTPSEVAAIILLVMTILVALALTIGLCYYVTKRSKRGMTQVPRDGFD